MVKPDVIVAPASGLGRAAIAVLRLSGTGTADIVAALAGRLPPPRRLALQALHAPDGTLLDRAMVVWLPGPASYTGEDSAELHVHAGRAVIDAVLQAVLRHGARLAAPGEFTRRAFLNGRMDLLEAEGIGDLVSAETEAQRRQALRQVEGEHSRHVATWHDRLLRLLAWQEALIDFPDEDIPAETEQALEEGIRGLAAELAEARRQAARGRRLRDGVLVAIVGPPNVGKSSLMNALAQRDVAIVSPIPGTTRDVLEARLDLGGIPVTVIDTAGLRATDDLVEAEGVRRAMARAAAADIVVLVAEAGHEANAAAWPDIAGDPLSRSRGDEKSPLLLRVANKVDLHEVADPDWLAISVATQAGLADLLGELTSLAARLAGADGAAVMSRARHETALDDAVGHLDKAAALGPVHPELRGEELRLAMRAVGRITGAVELEAVLDVVFSQFCIGK